MLSVRSLRVLVLGLAGLVSCSKDESPTVVVLVPTFSESWGLSQFDLVSSQHQTTYPSEPSSLRSGDPIAITLTNPDQGANPLPIDLWGLRAGQRVAYGHAEPIPVANERIEVPVEISLLPCGAWCMPGARECSEGGVRVCETGSDGCAKWGATKACDAATPKCSWGTCLATCANECAEGVTACAGRHAEVSCGNADADECFEWLAPRSCAANEVCEQGACRSLTECKDECEVGKTQCVGNMTYTCGQFDDDACLDWSPPSSCPQGESCSDGKCAPVASCKDDCNMSTCEGLSLRTCGQYDLDPCMDLSSGTTCTAADTCSVAGCDPTNGCVTAPLVCDQPPEARCTNNNMTKLVYAAEGTCSDGTCKYEEQEIACPNCPNCDLCLNVSCEEIPARKCHDDGFTLITFTGAGTCSEGICDYPKTEQRCDYGCYEAACVSGPKRIVLFGGRRTDAYLSDTWEWDGSKWAERRPAHSPSQRSLPAMASYQGKVLLFGGHFNGVPLSDTWEWDGNDWTRLASSGPPARDSAAMAQVGDKSVLFAGITGDKRLSDTWEWNGSGWKSRSIAGPAPRDEHTMVSRAGKALLFGGRAGNTDYYSDTWQFDGTEWKKLSASFPKARKATGVAMLGGRLLLFGGSNSAILSDTWQWDNGTWKQLSPSTKPSAREAHGMASIGGKIYLFGGWNGMQFVDDTWEWTGTNWKRLNPTGPSVRAAFGMAAY